MDTALKNGDFELGPNGRPKSVGGVRELFQRAEIRLRVPLGGFVYDPLLGSRLRGLDPADPELEAKALAAAQETLRPLPAVTVFGVRRILGEPPAVSVRCGCAGETKEIEVEL